VATPIPAALLAEPVDHLPRPEAELKSQAPPTDQAPPPETKPAAADAVDLLAKKALEETGWDLLTGQVLDPEQFQKWKQQRAQPTAGGRAALANASILEVFRKARLAVEQWVDDDQNRRWIMDTAAGDIKANPEVLVLIKAHADAGTEMHDKLLHHLEFMVDNRRQYYLAVGDGLD
jgi:hypothetical protein